MAKDAKRELVDFLVRRAFDPVLKASANGRSEAERSRLEHVQEATRAEIDRYEAYGSARDVVTNFKRDLNSSAAKKIHAELEALKLPTIKDVREDFERRADKLGVKA